MSIVTTTLYGDLALLPLEALDISREVLEWKTDLFISNDGTEETEKLRANARRKIYYKFFEDYINKLPGLITQYGAYTELWAVPLWMERQYIGSIPINFNKDDDPATLPAGFGNNVDFSKDDSLLAVAHDDTPFVTIYTTADSVKLADPAILPTGNARDVAFNHDDTLLAVAHSVTPFVTIYDSSVPSAFSKIADPAVLPSSSAHGVSFSHDGSLLVVCHEVAPFVTIYDTSDWSKIATPSTTPTGTAKSATFSDDDSLLSIAHFVTPFITTYTTADWLKLTDPSTLPTGDGFSVTFNNDSSLLAIAHLTTPFVTIYNTTTWSKVTGPASGDLPPSTATGVSFNDDDSVLAVSHFITPFFTTYNTVDWSKNSNPGTLPASTGQDVAFNSDSSTLAMANSSTPFITLYNMGTSLTAVTDIYDFRDDSLALLYESPSSWQIIEIETVNASSLDLYTDLSTFTKAYLVPVRVCTILNDIIRMSSGHNVLSEIGFEVVDVLDTPESTPSQYLSSDYYADELFQNGERYQNSISNNLETVDFTVGKIIKKFPWENNRITKPFYNLFDSQTDIFNFREFLTRRSGRYRSYWEPTFEVDLISKSTGSLTTSLLVRDDGFLDWDKQREHIAILDTSGDWHFRAIESATQSDTTTVELTLDTSLAMESTEIDTISFLGLRRFNSDIITLKWLKGGMVMETKIDTIEVSP